MPDLFDQIRSAAANVSQRARRVKINESAIAEYARSLPVEKMQAPALDPEAHYIGSVPQTVAFFITLDAINFGSGYFPHLTKLPGRSGYFTVATHLAGHFRKHGPLSARQLSEMTADRCRQLFQQPQGSAPIDELMTQFARALVDLGELLERDFRGDPVQLVASCDHSAQKLLRTLAKMPLFRDVQDYDGTAVPFYKRAQLTAADLALALPDEDLCRFDDLNRLTIFADNLVPHVLRCDGILDYDPELARRIDRAELIEANSPEEVEIRAGAVHASELIVRELNRIGRSVTSAQLDYLLWNRGQEPAYKARPRHRARTVYY